MNYFTTSKSGHWFESKQIGCRGNVAAHCEIYINILFLNILHIVYTWH